MPFLIVIGYNRFIMGINADIQTALEGAGLSEKEIKAYIVLLEMGPQHANAVARGAGITRANVYYHLEQLKEKGLITTYSNWDNTQFFKAEPANSVVKYLKQKQKKLEDKIEQVDQIAESLDALADSGGPQVPSMKIYDSVEKVESLYDEILESDIMNAIVNIDRVDEFFPKFGAKFPELVSERGINVKELVVDTDGAKSYKKSVKGDTHDVRILSKEFSHQTDILIYNNEVAFISYDGSPSAFVVQNPAIFATQQQVFDELWKKTD